jgi:hypothetical protein
MAKDGKVRFELKEHFTRVEVAVQEHDEMVVIAGAPLETNDPAIIMALDATEGVKRAEGRAPAGDKEQAQPQATTPRRRGSSS